MAISIAYLVAAAFFVLALKGLVSPRTAPRGNLLGALGMLIAIVATLLGSGILTFELIIAGLIVGALLGAITAVRVKMTAMPQLVAAFNGFGGGASALVAGSALLAPTALANVPQIQASISTSLSGIIGGLTFAGSMVALGKLQEVFEWQPKRPLIFQIASGVLAVTGLALAVILIYDPSAHWAFWGLLAAWSLVGILVTVPVGGADMPVVIALLNSCSGLAAASTGFVLGNTVLIISGALVGASGLVLTLIMSRAMNRSVPQIVFGGFGSPAASRLDDADTYDGRVTSASPEEAAMLLESAKLLVVVPGYGMAVAQAQHVVRDLANLLEQRGCEVRYAIHPVAGRMPGHMNVLLAEANIPYEKLYDLDQINDFFPQVDVSLVIGANDVVNPAAQLDPASPIFGMPVLEVSRSRAVMVVKRSLSPGFAGIPNELFAMPNTMMLFGDGQAIVRELIRALRE